MTVISTTWLLSALTSLAGAQSTLPAGAEPPVFSFGKVFTFLFLTLGPLKIIGPFAEMTRGRDAAFRRELAYRGAAVAAVGLLVAVTIGTRILDKWGISVGALLLTAGIVLFLVALRPVLEQYAGHDARAEAAQTAATSEHPSKALAITPLAFPTIVTPYGVAVLILLMALGANRAIGILAVTAAVLGVDLLAMLGADRILRTPFVRTLLLIIGMVLGILQVALGIQTAAAGVRLLGLAGAGAG